MTLTPMTANYFGIVVPDDARDVSIVPGIPYDTLWFIRKFGHDGTCEMSLPDNAHYRLICVSSTATEEQARDIVEYKEGLPFIDYDNKKGTPHYADYTSPLYLSNDFSKIVGYKLCLFTALESFQSLLTSAGLQGKNVAVVEVLK